MDNDILGYLSYDGDSIKDGVFDARLSAKALIGFDNLMRYFVKIENPELKDVDFNFPVKVKQGSWVIEIPENITQIIAVAGGTTLLTTYLVNLAKKAATDGFLETGPIKDIKKIFQGAVKLLQWCVKIKKKLKSRKIEEKIDLNTNTVTLEIDSEAIVVPISVYLIYKKLPSDIFDNVAEAISEDVSLSIGVKNDEGEIEKERISYTDKPYFYTSKDIEPEILFPELKDGELVELEGDITRNNDKRKTIGFEYRGYILTCEPYENQPMAKFKNQIISKSEDKFYASVVMQGYIDRSDGANKPKIKFTQITPKESANIISQKLF